MFSVSTGFLQDIVDELLLSDTFKCFPGKGNENI